MTNKEVNENIKREIRDAGYCIKDFSVSVKDCGYSTSIRVIIKNPEVNRNEIKKLLVHWQEIDKDERTGDILEGGNAYLFVDYIEGIFDEIAYQQWSATAKSVYESPDETTRIFDGLYFINLNHSGNFEIRQQNSKDFCTLKCADFISLCIYIYKFVKFGTIAA